MNKRILKYGAILLLVFVVIQVVTYYTIGEERLLGAMGKNYVSYTLKHNAFKGITIVSKLDINSNAVKENFKQFENYEVLISNDLENPFAPISANRYEYIIINETKNPFKINTVIEKEHAPMYGASFKSLYVWILFDWVLIKKENSGIS